MSITCKASSGNDKKNGVCSEYGKPFAFYNMQSQQPYFVACNVDNDLAVAEVCSIFSTHNNI